MVNERETRLNLDSGRLLVSGSLGTPFCNLLEQEEQIKLVADREKHILQQLELSRAKHHLEIQVESEREAAFLLRVYKPEMILGSQKNNLDEITNQLGSQLGIPNGRCSVSGISDRLIGREKVSIVVLSTEVELDKTFKKLPENGILVTIHKNN